MITLYLAFLPIAIMVIRFFNFGLPGANDLLMAAEKPADDTVESPRDNTTKPPVKPNRQDRLLPQF